MSGSSFNTRKTRSAAASADCSSLTILAASLIGPENFLEYNTKEEILPSDNIPNKYKTAPNTATIVREILLIKLTVGPTILP